jgi:cytoskeletal protein CcmA (bactofilin family)
VFKKAEDQEWTRFRGALSKDRDETPEAPDIPPPPVQAAPLPQQAPQPQMPGPMTVVPPQGGQGFRPNPNDVNVGQPTRQRFGHDQDVETLVGEHTSFEGTLKADGSIRVLGNVKGELQSKGSIYVEEQATVNAKITAAHVTVAGKVDGHIQSDGRVEIRPTGRVIGEISAGALIVQEGAFFDGSSKMKAQDAPSHR